MSKRSIRTQRKNKMKRREKLANQQRGRPQQKKAKGIDTLIAEAESPQ